MVSMFLLFVIILSVWAILQLASTQICFRSFNNKSLSTLSQGFESTNQDLEETSQELPEATIVLTLRAADPSLKSCLLSVLHQDYPNFQIKIVVDSTSDPAWNVVQELIREEQCSANVSVVALKNILGTCSLRCNALIQAFNDLDASCGVVAVIDTDTIAHKTWLKELVTPLVLDPSLSVTMGNRWYLPTGRLWGSAVRYVWNITAVTRMVLGNIPWGGSVAIRTSVLRDSDFLERMSYSINDDVLLGRILEETGLRSAFVPSVLMLNHEECELSGFFRWSKRQILWTRLYSSQWKVLVLHGVFTTVLPLSILCFGFFQICFGNLFEGVELCLLFLSYCLFLAALMVTWEAKFRALTDNRDALVWSPLSPVIFSRLLLAIVLGMATYLVALFGCMFMKKVSWRGITYEIHSPDNVEVINYQPYQDSSKTPVELVKLSVG